MKVQGKVVQRKFGSGSKSEHVAVYLLTEPDEYVLRKVGENPFDNAALKKLVGKEVIATGTVVDYIFLATDIKVLD